MRAQLSEEIRHAVVGKAEAFAAAHFAELRSLRRGCMALRASSTSCNEVYMILLFSFGLGIAVVVYRKLFNERLFYNDIRVRKERASQ